MEVCLLGSCQLVPIFVSALGHIDRNAEGCFLVCGFIFFFVLPSSAASSTAGWEPLGTLCSTSSWSLGLCWCQYVIINATAVTFQIMFKAGSGLSGRMCKGIGRFEVPVVFRVVSALVNYGW